MKDGIMFGTAITIAAILVLHQFVRAKTSSDFEVLQAHFKVGIFDLIYALCMLGISEIVILVRKLIHPLNKIRYKLDL